MDTRSTKWDTADLSSSEIADMILEDFEKANGTTH